MRYFISFLIVLGLLVLVIFLLFHGGNKPKPQASLTAQTLSDYAGSDTEVILTIDGPINYVQDHQGVRITVSRDNVTYEELRGYSGDTANVQNFANTQDAYTIFLKSLEHLRFTKGNNDPKLKDERGYCPAGDRYIFQFRQSGQDLERYWATSCGAKTYLGYLNQTLDLFKAQVPDYLNRTKNVTL